MTMKFDLVIDASVELAETPIWDSRINKLYWTDLFAGAVHRYDPVNGSDESVETHSFIGSAIPCISPNKLLVAISKGIMLLDFETGALTLVCQPQKDMSTYRYNDTRCDSTGRIFTSTVSTRYTEPVFDPESMTGKFFMIETDGSVITLRDKLVQYNTIFFDNQNDNLFVVDTYNKKLLRFDYSVENGASGTPDVVIHFDDMPDGVCVDNQNNIYVSHWSANKHITVWNLDTYTQINSIPLPVKHICCAGFGGSDMKDLYVATSKFGLPAGDPDFDAGAGGIFRTCLEVQGMKEYFYPDKP